MGKIHITKKSQIDKRKAKNDKLQQLREEIRTTRPPQSNPELAARVEKIEKILGLRKVEENSETKIKFRKPDWAGND